MALFKNRSANNQLAVGQPMTERQLYERKYATGRSNLLVMILFTLVNTVLCLVKSSSYFLFSAQVPYSLAYEAMWWGGKMSAEEYYNTYGILKEEFEFYPQPVFNALVAIAVTIILVYFLCWIFSKKDRGWLTGALVLFIIDTVIMVLMSFFYYVFDVSMIIDWAFHIWVIVYLVSGVNAARKLRKLPEEDLIPEEPVAEETVANVPNAENETKE